MYLDEKVWPQETRNITVSCGANCILISQTRM